VGAARAGLIIGEGPGAGISLALAQGEFPQLLYSGKDSVAGDWKRQIRTQNNGGFSSPIVTPALLSAWGCGPGL